MNLADLIDAALPQTQCTRCGYPDCRSYADAIDAKQAHINQCPPGGAEGVARLAAITGRPARPLNPINGVEATRGVAVIDEAWCIGCTLCIKACPADCIVGAPKAMHVVVTAQCTGCELCVPACPVDCISMPEVTTATGWAAWSQPQADEARERYIFRKFRRHREAEENEARLAASAQAKLADLAAASAITDPAQLDRKRAAIEAALARARAKRG
ncbi:MULTISPECIES: electron transport complex subunit RsxB [unclassified Roseateles]|uniref:electron transport complex subunit RsxB n=1 Tax=unclassified Roseateles TaxID=2626991 RepID=UPI0006F595C0|nr:MULTISPECIES: electron transport complex subunit RsxB [unclassified Roseateles]KQW43710.1 ferredoxin [Pelomonas sp. Root405]KRA71448.1 ferredoxin [Pelomonas sp. Root662]